MAEKTKRSLFRNSEVTLNFVIGDAFRVSFARSPGILTVDGAGRDMASAGRIFAMYVALINVASCPIRSVAATEMTSIFTSTR